MKKLVKYDFPVERVREYLEPGPVVLVSSRWKDETDIMTMGWHMVMEFTPALLGCIIAGSNHSFDLIRKSRECVINIPTLDMKTKIVGIGNTSGDEIDKFDKFKLSAGKALKVKAPLIDECYASLECKLHDASLIDKYNFFIFKVLKAHVARRPKHPRTLHYRGQGEFMVAGSSLNMRSRFLPRNLP